MTDRSNILRGALAANGVFSAVSGLALIVASDTISEFLGLNFALWPLGAGLLIYAAGLFRNARRESICRTEAWIAVFLDAAWVIVSALLLFVGALSREGNWAVGMTADVVLLFAVLQIIGLRRLRRSEIN
jgi:predicted lysophospholipase L1 biosynthesis ABC-type transport system permease subunit